MIASLRGTVTACGSTSVVIEVGGVGIRAEVAANAAASSRIGDELFLFTQLVVREDSLTLFGFETADELELFNLLTTVSGVGPRLGLSILSSMSPEQIAVAIEHGDEKPFTAVSGVGAKTAKLILISLQGKVQGVAFGNPHETKSSGDSLPTESTVVQALVGLGWAESVSADAVRAARHAGAATDQASLLKASLVLLQQAPVRG